MRRCDPARRRRRYRRPALTRQTRGVGRPSPTAGGGSSQVDLDAWGWPAPVADDIPGEVAAEQGNQDCADADDLPSLAHVETAPLAADQLPRSTRALGGDSAPGWGPVRRRGGGAARRRRSGRARTGETAPGGPGV